MGHDSGFEPADGDGPEETVADAGRAAEVRAAYEGLLQIRRLTGGVEAPSPWELRLMPRAVAIVLEAAGHPPSAVDARGLRSRTGYRVVPGADRVEVTWTGPPGSGAAAEERERLKACAAELERHGWECLLYRGPRGRRFLEVEAPPTGRA
ncbi:hypothetical protein [Streptomyces sp. RerS4]|uniref:hypothetical protein n=1 Tax=Streptomyces sp. RerS4 TaxID=2942449 RepID=UPI00201C4830|nr:hypothetical protein [Streptomyces sp. RerS4]UQX04834.1 hypothetical protein M4D82_03895 [Streptomyces sp. RerS4]